MYVVKTKDVLPICSEEVQNNPLPLVFIKADHDRRLENSSFPVLLAC